MGAHLVFATKFVNDVPDANVMGPLQLHNYFHKFTNIYILRVKICHPNLKVDIIRTIRFLGLEIRI